MKLIWLVQYHVWLHNASDGCDDISFAITISDEIVEPARKKMIPGFDKVKEECIEMQEHLLVQLAVQVHQ